MKPRVQPTAPAIESPCPPEGLAGQGNHCLLALAEDAPVPDARTWGNARVRHVLAGCVRVRAGRSACVAHRCRTPGSEPDRKSPFESLRLGLMVILGPDAANFEEAYRALAANAGAFEVGSVEALADSVVRFQDASKRAPYLSGARRTLAAGDDAVETTLRAISGKLAL